MTAEPGSTRQTSGVARDAESVTNMRHTAVDCDSPPGNAAAPGVGTEGERTDSRTGCLDSTASTLFTGALLLATPHDAVPALRLVNDDDLEGVRNRTIVAACRYLLADEVPLDPATVAGYLAERGISLPATSTPIADLFVMASTAPPPVMLPHLARAVVVAAVRRRGAEALRELANLWQLGDVSALQSATELVFGEILDDLARVGGRHA